MVMYWETSPAKMVGSQEGEGAPVSGESQVPRGSILQSRAVCTQAAPQGCPFLDAKELRPQSPVRGHSQEEAHPRVLRFWLMGVDAHGGLMGPSMGRKLFSFD